MRISWKLSDITKGLKNPEEVIGKPITVEGIVVGKIEEIDKENDLCFGEISRDVELHII